MTVILQSLMMYEEQAKIPRFLPHTETILFTCRLQNQKNFPWKQICVDGGNCKHPIVLISVVLARVCLQHYFSVYIAVRVKEVELFPNILKSFHNILLV